MMPESPPLTLENLTGIPKQQLMEAFKLPNNSLYLIINQFESPNTVTTL